VLYIIATIYFDILYEVYDQMNYSLGKGIAKKRPKRMPVAYRMPLTITSS